MRNITEFRNSEIYRSKIHDLIPGGAHTYTKGDDQFPEMAPAAIARGKGAYVWDVDDNKYLDCSMGLTSVSLGHSYESVNEAVRRELEKGVNFQRPSYLELEMAEKFISLLPGHDMIKFSKNGSTATTAAVKLARAYTNRKYVVFPSDHPFYSYDDWFIGKTACNRGVPEEISNLSLTFISTDLRTLKALFEAYPNQIACVITEPEKSNVQAPDYVKQVCEIAHENGALFIMDEMITGFKTDFPGSFSKYGVVPDMSTWGKGIANGYSFSALTGKREVMELGGIRKTGEEKVFLISSTHGGETISMAACLATINEFQSQNVIAHNHSIGRYFSSRLKESISSQRLTGAIEFFESEWFPLFIFKNSEGKACPGMRTLMLQEMIRRGVLFQGIFVPCFSHTSEDVDYFTEAFNDALKIYSAALDSGFERFLKGEPAKPVFRKFL